MADKVETTVASAPAEDTATAAVASIAISETSDKADVAKETKETKESKENEETKDNGDASLPAHRSHDPENNRKRTDPFMFGQRFLTAEDNVFEFNAWDHVETDDAFKEYSEKQYALQRASPVSDFDKTRFNSDPARWWNLFYKNNAANFFKDRKWLQQEFPVLNQVCEADAGPKTILEVGAGAGNTAFPILARNKNPHLRVHACDFSKTAVDVMRGNPAYDPQFIQADVWDVSSTAATDEERLPPGLGPNSVDVAILVFIFSALSPSQWTQAVANLARLVKPGGVVCFRDYGRGDLAQVRFRKGRYLEENFYIRGDGTRVYFFERDELVNIWTGEEPKEDKEAEKAEKAEGAEEEEKEEKADKENKSADTNTDHPDNPDKDEQNCGPFELEDIGVDRRLIVNRASKVKMYRCWIQGRFRRKADPEQK